MKLFKRDKVISFLHKHFSFEGDVDLSNETEVLYRKNIVIKNIILLSNLVYSGILFIVTFGSNDPGAWLFSVIPFPITFVLNRTIKKLIHQDKDILVSQQVGMYMLTLYMFLSAILIYLKLETSSSSHLATGGYMLIYFSLIVVSLYQDRKMLKMVFTFMLPIMTAVHMFITHKIYSLDYANDVFSFLKVFLSTEEFKDIAFRTVILVCFMVIVYVSCIIGEKISEARTEELGKRQEIQEDFTTIVTNLFDVLIKSHNNQVDNERRDQAHASMTNRLASLCGYAPNKCNELANYSLFLSTHKDDFKLENIDSSEDNFEYLRNQSVLGTQLVKRIELAQKSERIIRAHSENSVSPYFTSEMNKIQKNDDSDIVLLCDIYITLRDHTTYKKRYSHPHSMDIFKNNLSGYFDARLLERFIAHHNVFEEIFEEEY